MTLEQLEPKEVFHYFKEICKIPHGSGNVKQISDYCVDFAKQHGLKYRQDESLNVIIWKDGTSGYENSPAVILQGHIDMVAVKEEDCIKDMEKEGLDLEIQDGYLSAKQTSLGGDDGIAVAYSLALLASTDIPHPPLEAVFTVDEEIGMLGAAAIDLSDLKGKIMLNMDSEDEGIFLAGCAGGASVRCDIPVTKGTETGVRRTLTLKGFTGGHSGTEIICQRANTNILMGRILMELNNEMSFFVTSISGGEKDNAIAKVGKLELLIQPSDAQTFTETMEKITATLKREYEVTDPDMQIVITEDNEEKETLVYNPSCTMKLMLALVHLPYGVVKMSNDIKGLVQTSLNLGIIKETQDCVRLCYSVRSSVGSEKEWLIEKLYSLTEFYEELYHEKPLIQTIHAGVECGLFSEKIPGLDCISFGPNILDIHTTNEHLDIASVERTWKLILEVLEKLK